MCNKSGPFRTEKLCEWSKLSRYQKQIVFCHDFKSENKLVWHLSPAWIVWPEIEIFQIVRHNYLQNFPHTFWITLLQVQIHPTIGR